MARYSIEPRDRIFAKGYGILSFAKKMNIKIGKNKSKRFGGKYRQELLDLAKQAARDELKNSSKRTFQKTAEATGDLISNENPDKIT